MKINAGIATLLVLTISNTSAFEFKNPFRSNQGNAPNPISNSNQNPGPIPIQNPKPNPIQNPRPNLIQNPRPNLTQSSPSGFRLNTGNSRTKPVSTQPRFNTERIKSYASGQFRTMANNAIQKVKNNFAPQSQSQPQPQPQLSQSSQPPRYGAVQQQTQKQQPVQPTKRFFKHIGNFFKGALGLG